MSAESPASQTRRYRDSRRRMLLDMHIPDWDDGFLGRYEPMDYVRAAERAGADGVMLYFQSHLGLCYWPTQTGVRHRAARSRDLAGEALAGFHRTVRVKDLPAHGGGVIAVERGIVTSVVARVRIRARAGQ